MFPVIFVGLLGYMLIYTAWHKQSIVDLAMGRAGSQNIEAATPETVADAAAGVGTDVVNALPGTVGDAIGVGTGALGKVTIGPNANRPGVSIQPKVTNFVAKIAALVGTPINIGTGTNHNQYVAGGGSQSWHWTGEAADVPVPIDSKRGDTIAAAALILAGMSPNQARSEAQKGGVWNLSKGNRRYQILWKTMVGGNHHNHVHIGVK